MSRALARTVSIIGHPTIVVPASVAVLMLQSSTYVQAAWTVSGLLVFVALVMGYSKWQVRRGRWSHVDASSVGERRTLNVFLLLALGVGILLAIALGAPRELSLGLALSAAVVAAAILTQTYVKLSLHMAFVVFAAALLGAASILAMLAGLAFAGLVAWSRLNLQRHQPRDLVAGAAAGAVAGLLFHAVSRYWTG